jgi:hypothetical protein
METQPFHGHFPKAVADGMSTDWVRRDLQNEYKRGWQALADNPDDPRRTQLPAAARTVFLIRCPQPGRHGAALILAYAGVDFTRPGIEGVQIHYLREEGDGRITPLPEAAWADWDQQGRLLIATRTGAVCVCETRGDAWAQTWSQDLYDLAPTPVEAPAWIHGW